MALVSPGVEVNVIDESFYTPAAPGTVPMIFVASAQGKSNGSGTGTASGTLAANAGRPYLMTSQRELVETFGDPTFYTDANNNPINGGELNEYGLQAAYSLLGVSNRVYVTRADIDLGSLQPQAEEPGANPDDGTNWLDTQITQFGIFEWNGEPAQTTGGQSFSLQTPIVITDETRLVGGQTTGAPKASVGALGQYAVRATSKKITLYYKISDGTWVVVGSSDWKKEFPSFTGGVVGAQFSQGNDSFTISIPGSSPAVNLSFSEGDYADLDALVGDINNNGNTIGIFAENVNGRLYLYNSGVRGDSIQLSNATGTIFDEDKLNITAGTYYATALQISPHTDVPTFASTFSASRPTGSIWIKSTEPNLGARWRYKRYNGDVELFDEVPAPLYTSNAKALFELDRSGGGINLAQGETFVRYNSDGKSPAEAEFRIYSRSTVGATVITSGVVADQLTGGDSYSFDLYETQLGEQTLSGSTTITITAAELPDDADTVAGAINAAGLDHVVASVDTQNRVVITHELGGDIVITDTDGLMGDIGFVPFDAASPGTTTRHLYAVQGDNTGELIASNWREADFVASEDAPQNLAADGELWYNSVVDEADIMVHDGSAWVGYKNQFPDTNATGPIVSASEPTLQTNGDNLANGDIWIDTADIDNYPTIYRYNQLAQQFDLVDKTDQTTDSGVLFADARWNTSGANSDTQGSIVNLLESDYLDPDAPDPALYPRGMLLFNLRRSGFNVKRFVRNYIDVNEDNIRFNDESMSGYYVNRWVTESANQNDGSGSFGRIAQRKVVTQSLQAMLSSNQDIRDNESRLFNVMATPGYPELIGEMITLNFDRGLSAFIVGDSPMRLRPDATSLNEWGQNVRNAVEDNAQGLVSFDEYLGVYYPAGFTSDNAGNNVVVPASHMALRTIALSDQVSYPWFAPAGTRRGGVTNATSSGYINDEGEFVSISLNQGQRDTLYTNSVNPITFLAGSGLVVFGQKTRARNASALDRINVARLVVYLRTQLNRLAKPYLFEPNDKSTRDEIKGVVESLMLELVGQRALYDYIVVCDETNNTPARIDRNELYVDVAIEPVKAIEFIFIPLRLKNTGEIAGL
jgi:hypothetical protein